jgi:L-malate glycosyltransferase
MKKVLILYKSIPQYRIEFFNQLREKLISQNIELELIYGDTYFENRNDEVACEWAKFKRNKIIRLGPFKFIWQPCLKEVNTADLVIVEQANKLLINYILVLRKRLQKNKFSFWGHGLNLQSGRNSISNLFKKLYVNEANWWFAYTKSVKDFLINNNYSSNNITVIQNSFDTKKLKAEFDSITNEEVLDLKSQCDIQIEEKVLIYCGALYKEKRLDFLVKVCDILNEKGFKFKLLIIGNGKDIEFIKQASLTRSYLKYVGPKFGRFKAAYFKLADIFLLPGAVGLAVLDSFVFQTPIVTTNYNFHGPEIDYILNGFNGIITENSISEYTIAVEELLNDSEKLLSLKNNCSGMIELYNIDIMVENFVYGVKQALMEN